jgi:hypothetical protein
LYIIISFYNSHQFGNLVDTQDFPVTINDARNLSSFLQENGWITKGTRMIIITTTAYNRNIGGAFVAVRLTFKVSATGGVLPDLETAVVSTFAYDENAIYGTVSKILLEILCAAFICYELILTEVKEVSYYKLEMKLC